MRRPAFSSLLMPAVLTAFMSAAPAEAVSSLSLPITVPLAGVQGAANARVPAEFARVQQTQNFLGGLLSVQLAGTVTRAGHVSVKPAPEGDALIVSVPIRADFRATPGGIGSFLARDFGGAATVSLRVSPFVTPDWEAGARITGDYAWTDPLSVELTQGVRVSVQSLVDGQVRDQLDRVAADVAKAVREGANLRTRAGTLWARAQQPWTLPTADPAYARVTPRSLSVSPFRFTEDALKLTVGAAFDLTAGLGRAPAVASALLPALNVAAPSTSGVQLSVPVRLPYAELSQVATRAASAQVFPLPVPLSPKLRINRVTVQPKGSKLLVTASLTITALGLNVNATADISGTPVLDNTGRIVTLSGVTVQTHREGVTGRVLSWLADSRAEAYLARAARFDLGPRLDQARAEAQARLPYAPTPGIRLGGTVGPLKLTALTVAPDALTVTAAAGGELTAGVDAKAVSGQ
jgi:hypothetical protein